MRLRTRGWADQQGAAERSCGARHRKGIGPPYGDMSGAVSGERDAERAGDGRQPRYRRHGRGRAAGGMRTRSNPAVSLILNGVLANLSQDPARPPDYRLHAHRGEVGPGRPGPEPGRQRTRLQRQCRPEFPRQADRRSRRGQFGLGGGGLYPGHRPRAGAGLQGRALSLQHRLPERTAPARLGLLRRAAGEQGVPRQTSSPTTACS